MKTVISHIAHMATAYRTCAQRATQPLGGDAERWARKHLSALLETCRNTLPSGCGFDSGVTLDLDDSDLDGERYVFDVPFHVMNEVGYYVGWARYRVAVTPSFISTINLEIARIETTDDDAECGLDDLIGESMHDALTSMHELPTTLNSEV